MKYFRRVLLVDRKFQLTFLLYATGLAIVGIVFNSFLQGLRQAGLECVPREGSGGPAMAPYLIGLFIALATFVIVAFVGLIISNRMAGPLYRLRHHMNNVASGGEIQDIKFRDNDFFNDIAREYNAVLRRLRNEK